MLYIEKLLPGLNWFRKTCFLNRKKSTMTSAWLLKNEFIELENKACFPHPSY